MKEKIGKSYRGFSGWLRYVRDYKENILNESIMEGEIVEANKKTEKIKAKYIATINELEKELKEKEYLANEKDKLLEKRNKRIEILNKDYSDLKKRANELRELITKLSKTVDKQKVDLAKKEKQRRKNAGAIGGLTTENNKLKEELNKANYTVNYYRKNRKEPTIEELKAYEYSRREVEKRQKTIQVKDSDITCGTLNASKVTTAESNDKK